MMRFIQTLAAWGSTNIAGALKQDIDSLDISRLPLQQGLSQGSHVCTDKLAVMIIHTAAQDHSLFIKAGIFYSSLIAGCHCADDPGPVDELSEYCILGFTIDRKTAETSVRLLEE